MNEDFCLQARRFFAAILTDRKRKQRSLRGKKAVQTVCNGSENSFQQV